MNHFRIKDLILICGYARSGTTWLAKLFDSRTQTYLIFEPDKRLNYRLKFGRLRHCIQPQNIKWTERYRVAVDEILASIYFNLNVFPYFKKNYLNLPRQFHPLLQSMGHSINYIVNEFGCGPAKLPNIFMKNNSKIDLVWKSINQSTNLEFLMETFPGIKIIYILRNPYAVFASILQHSQMTLKGEKHILLLGKKGAPFFHNNDIDLERILKCWSEIEIRALHWRIECESALIAGKKNNNFHLILYEDLALNPSEVILKLFNWLGWDIEKQTESFLLQSSGRKKVPWFYRNIKSGYFGVYRNPGGNVEGWKNKLSIKHYDMISAILRRSNLLTYWPDYLLNR